jgi:hypothetical protein
LVGVVRMSESLRASGRGGKIAVRTTSSFKSGVEGVCALPSAAVN